MDEAIQATIRLLEAIPEGMRGKFKRNAERIASLSKECLESRPILEPTATLISRLGRMRFGTFPAPQSILNIYSDYLRPYRFAYEKLLTANSPKVRAATEEVLNNRPSSGNEALLIQIIIEQKRKLDAAMQLIRETAPLPSPDPTPLGEKTVPAKVDASRRVLDLEPLEKWLEDLELGRNLYVEFDALGLRVARTARARSIIMRADAYACMKECIDEWRKVAKRK
ncbi:hypothetical protein [Azorhizobium oxalatiphilum]|uniref:hypothetical protein n=1 Tax=Azorhizobium oxalatiphilum TaxID=980631 RepID=UPI0016666004|nr:hypothetical protein [Azorhizobium oxalatiphilum]